MRARVQVIRAVYDDSANAIVPGRAKGSWQLESLLGTGYRRGGKME